MILTYLITKGGALSCYSLYTHSSKIEKNPAFFTFSLIVFRTISASIFRIKFCIFGDVYSENLNHINGLEQYYHAFQKIASVH